MCNVRPQADAARAAELARQQKLIEHEQQQRMAEQMQVCVLTFTTVSQF